MKSHKPFLCILPFLALTIGGCPRKANLSSTAVSATAVSAQQQPITFTDIAKEAGVDFTHVNGSNGRKLMPETVGSGVAFLDYDNDSHLDLLIINSTTWLSNPKPIKTTPKLYHNLGNGKFIDVTQKSGLAIYDLRHGSDCRRL
jgi:enediyne biosynthesis protein E4